ncbi:hypothetical protein BOSEA1005_11199 [Hyphomicrobiales bacterium]|nr:hypothetical protein BOSEA1005_11199 [Hyphomicrobiales bacterium]CAI0347797.1 hypothetical protein BO1005MUT1_90158 [Hyphomicrobiales bacterium]
MDEFAVTLRATSWRTGRIGGTTVATIPSTPTWLLRGLGKRSGRHPSESCHSVKSIKASVHPAPNSNPVRSSCGIRLYSHSSRLVRISYSAQNPRHSRIL